MDTASESHEEKIAQLASLSGADALAAMGSSAAGLTSDQAAKLQAKYGKNLIQAAKKKSPVLAFLSNFTHLMAILLWAAGIIALVAGMPELCVAVWLVNLINGCFSFWQEHQADKATEALKKMLPSYVNSSPRCLPRTLFPAISWSWPRAIRSRQMVALCAPLTCRSISRRSRENPIR